MAVTDTLPSKRGEAGELRLPPFLSLPGLLDEEDRLKVELRQVRQRGARQEQACEARAETVHSGQAQNAKDELHACARAWSDLGWRAKFFECGTECGRTAWGNAGGGQTCSPLIYP